MMWQAIKDFINLWLPSNKAPTKPKVATSKLVVHDTTHNIWGRTIIVSEDDGFSRLKVYGWKSPHICEGDVYSQEMLSGNKGLFKLVNVRNTTNPSDMFFADAEFVGWWRDLPEYVLSTTARQL